MTIEELLAAIETNEGTESNMFGECFLVDPNGTIHYAASHEYPGKVYERKQIRLSKEVSFVADLITNYKLTFLMYGSSNYAGNSGYEITVSLSEALASSASSRSPVIVLWRQVDLNVVKKYLWRVEGYEWKFEFDDQMLNLTIRHERN
jgi:hypothetical protein